MEKKPTIPSYKRRLNDWDYSQPRIYMLTLATEGRLPLFGELAGDAGQPDGSADAPRLEPSALGAAVLQEVDGIPGYYPQITIISRQLMPDHLHILLYVTSPLPVHLGQVVAGFKAGCNRKWKELCNQDNQQSDRQNNQRQNRWTPNQQNRWAQNQQNRQAPDQPLQGQQGQPAGSAAGSVPGGSAAREKGLLWEQGYHDRVLSGKDQLQRLIDYIHDNPRRSLVKRQHREWFQLSSIEAAGCTLQTMGNLRLLNAASRRAVRISNRLDDRQRTKDVSDLLDLARQGAVLISPFISPGEHQAEQAALQEGLPIVKLLPSGMAPFFKPQGQYFEACAQGRLLLMTPYPYSSQKVTLTRSACNYLNTIAARLSE